jgi:hypothetical protein
MSYRYIKEVFPYGQTPKINIELGRKEVLKWLPLSLFSNKISDYFFVSVDHKIIEFFVPITK